jgi:uncharacterized membrane protein
MSGNEITEFIRTLIEWIALGIEILAVAVIVAGVLAVVVSQGPVRSVFRPGKAGAYESFKHQLGRPLLLGLDLLVAGDLVKTVALEPTLINIEVLGLLVLIRTFLNWSLVVEIEGRWPWQSPAKKQ